MKVLTRVIQSGNNADFVLIDINTEYANWLLDIRDVVLKNAKERPQNPHLWSVFECEQCRFLQAKHCTFTGFDQYDEEIRTKHFVKVPDFIDVPETVDVEVQVAATRRRVERPASEDPGTSHPAITEDVDANQAQVAPPQQPEYEDVPAHTKIEPRRLEVATQRRYVTICEEGISWHAGTESFGRRALSTPRLSFEMLEAAAGVRTPETANT